MAAPLPLPASQGFPLDAGRAGQLAELVRGLDAPGLLWISGYTAGLAAALPAAAVPAADPDAPWGATIVYGSQTGNGRRIAQAILRKLGALRPADAPYFAARYADFDRRLAAAEQRWDAALAPFKGTKVVTYHRSWSNLVDRFGLDVIGFVEPRPGIPPSPAHTFALMQEMKRAGVKVLLVEPYFDLKTPNSIARETGAKVVVLPPSTGGVPQAGSYLALFDHVVGLLAGALRGR